MKLSHAMHNAMVDAYKRTITNAEDQRVKCAPNTLAALRRRGFVYPADTTIAFQLTPEGFKYGEEWEDTTYGEAETSAEMPPTAGFLQGLNDALSGTTTAPPELDDNGRFIGDDSPFNVLENITLAGKPSDASAQHELNFSAFMIDQYAILAQSKRETMLCDGCDKFRMVRSDDGRSLLCRDCRRQVRKLNSRRTTRSAPKSRKLADNTSRRHRRDCTKAKKHRDRVENYHYQLTGR